MPEILWSRTEDGEQPDLIVGADRILMHRSIIRGGRKAVELVCCDLDGRPLWTQRGWSVMLATAGDRFVVNTPEGSPLVIDGGGRVVSRSDFAGVDRVVRHGDTLLFAGKRKVHATDLDLGRGRQIAWNSESPAIDCVVSGAIYWAEGDRLRRCPLDGEPEDVCPLPKDLVAETMDEWERTTGNSALAGWYFTSGILGATTFKPGDRPFAFYWRVAFDADCQQFLLANALGPHLILCLDRFGGPRWCTYLSCGCCGGVPSTLPNGLYVASSGCGGVLSWLDREGRVLSQSVPHKGAGLATAYTSEVRVLADCRCLANGGPGIVAYSQCGDLEWIFNRSYCRLHCDSDRQILVGCYWKADDSRTHNATCLELARGL